MADVTPPIDPVKTLLESAETRKIRAQLAADPELFKRLTYRTSKYMPFVPWPKQALFLMWQGRDLVEGFYGGSAGPGKSTCLLLAAAQYMDAPGFKAVIIRRTWDDLKNETGGLIPESKKWWGHRKDIKYNESDRAWKSQEGASLQFMHMEHPDDRFRLRGRAAHLLCYDESTEFEEEMYLYGFRSLRKAAGDLIPLRLLSASNPGGVGHEWVKKRFIKMVPKGQLISTYETVNRYNPQLKHECMVLLGTYADNPGLDQSYANTLDQLNPLERQRQKFGDWDAMSGGSFFKRENFKVVDRIPCPVIARIRAWDRAAGIASDSDWSVGIRGNLGEDGNVYFDDLIRDRWLSGDVENQMQGAAENDGVETVIWIQQDPAAAGKGEAERVRDEVLPRFNVCIEVTATSVKGAKALRARPLASASQRGQVFLVKGDWNDDFLNELQSFTEDGSHDYDDQVDAAAMCYRKLEVPVATTILEQVGGVGGEYGFEEDDLLDNFIEV